MPFITRSVASQMKTLPPLPNTNLSGKVYIITGGNSGIGFEVAKHLVERGAAKIILAVRDVKKGESARTDLLQDVKGHRSTMIEAWKVDMSSFETVKQFAQRCE
ncbi:uncharacterized protein I303_100210 [Kwoniella dejecticola CBS 10117]|uniref:Ketoreductase (KR) domain-containing protein n=1 Tax=Kwoniella dejecticola CBS 10117 TaxID=1296121 RepID=A0A1A6AEA6_9TREE|nr:uncharacterized protein I303_00212 [Kwoniella dejecticola CBS 10117]OBR88395.1 hypothetical protein I303_00212 [Kwoniella dejecticola CBS 10117]